MNTAVNWRLLANSFGVAAASAVCAFICGFAFALVLSASSRTQRYVLFGCAIAVLALPSFLVTNCWIALLGANGVLHPWLPLNIFSIPGAAFILSLLLWPIPAIAIWASWQRLEPIHFEIDPALRGSNLLRLLLWPTASPLALTSLMVTFALALNNFAVPAILQVKVYPAETWVQFNTNLDPVAALRLSWPLVVVPLLLLFVVRPAQVPWPRETGADFALALRRQITTPLFVLAMCVSIIVVILGLLVPLSQLAGTARTWREFIPATAAGIPALTHSFVYSATAAIFALAFGLLLARVRWLGWMWLLFLVPGILLGIGGISAFNRPGLDWFSQSACIVIALLVARYVCLARAVTRTGLLALDSLLLENARLDGARGMKFFGRIVLPQLAPQLATAAYIVYLLCLWDVETILLVIPPGGETLAVRIFNLLHYGYNAHVNALCMLLLLLAVAPLLPVTMFGWQRGRRRDLKVAIGMAILLLVGCSPESGRVPASRLNSSIFSHVEVIGSRGTGPGQFNKPRSLALDTNDNVFVVDMTGRVQKFSPNGKFLLSWQMPQTDLGKPKGMCRDRDGNIVVLEPHYQRVNHFTTEGKLVAQWGVKGTNAGELTLPRAIAVDTKNNVIVSEYTLVDRVQKFSPYGKRVLSVWGTPGLLPGEFNRAEGVGLDVRDDIHVADSCNHRIQVFSPDGKFLRTYGKAGERLNDMSYPYDICIDAQGRQFVCEFGNSRIQVFDAKDRAIEIIGKAGGEPGEFNKPWSIAFDSKGNLYVADSMNHRVQKLVRKESSRHQAASSREKPRSKLQAARRPLTNLDLDIWSFSGAWSLVPGAFVSP